MRQKSYRDNIEERLRTTRRRGKAFGLKSFTAQSTVGHITVEYIDGYFNVQVNHLNEMKHFDRLSLFEARDLLEKCGIIIATIGVRRI